MKKLMIAAAIVCAAAFAQAAAIDWSASAVLDPVATAAAGKNTAGVDWLGYVIMASDYSTVTADLAKGDTASLVSKHVGAVKQTTSKGAFATSTAEGNVASGSQDFYLVVLNSDSLTTFTGFYVSDKVTKDIDASLDTSILFGSQAAGTKVASNWTKTSSVPEPTSGLLMLLGVAGLALRRRRA